MLIKGQGTHYMALPAKIYQYAYTSLSLDAQSMMLWLDNPWAADVSPGNSWGLWLYSMVALLSASFRGPQLCSRTDPPPTVCWVIEWPTRSDVMITLSTQHARSGISQVIRVLTRTAALLTLSFRRTWKIQTCYDHVHTMLLFQHLVNTVTFSLRIPAG